MMTSAAANFVGTYLLREVTPLLKKVWAAGDGLDFNRLFLNHVRDRLHQTCVHFEQFDGDEEHEDLYLPIFDALSLLTEALQRKPIHRQTVLLAMDRLDELAHVLAAVPV